MITGDTKNILTAFFSYGEKICTTKFSQPRIFEEMYGYVGVEYRNIFSGKENEYIP